MSSKATSILDKVQKDIQRKSFSNALEKLEEGIRRYPDEFELYASVLAVALEAGESVKAQKHFSEGMKRFPKYQERLWTEAVGLVQRFDDVVLARATLDSAIKKRDFDSARGVLRYLTDPSAEAMLKRVQTKKLSLTNAALGALALSSERLMIAFAEALLLIRLKQHTDGAKILLDIIDEKPVEHSKLMTFFYSLEKTYTSEPVFTYGLGRCYLVAERYESAISKIMESIDGDRAWADDSLVRLEEIDGKSELPVEEYNLAMGRLYVMNGDAYKANERIRLVLAKNPRSATAVLTLLEPEVMEIGDNLILDYLYIDAALAADRIKSVVLRLRRIYRVEKHQKDLLEWLETRQKGILPAEVLRFYGEIALERNMHEKAVEILRQVVTQHPYEAGAVREAMSDHTSHAGIKEFHDELVAESDTEPASDGFKIEHLGGGTKFSAPQTREKNRRKDDKKATNLFRESSPFASNQSRPAIEMDGTTSKGANRSSSPT